ncbi:MAG TPA: MaoC family dehydratase [Xanthomonadales bacterium]|nr:MaoC family dehydratase [Xanthomonadales bacterium]
MSDAFPAALRARIEQASAPGDWIVVDQARIDAFAVCTGDTYWIHTDAERARRETPFGGTIAHGFLLLSLIAGPGSLHLGPLPGVAQALNYGLERVRFLTPVPAGSQVRVLTRIDSLEQKEAGRWLLRQEKTVELRGAAKPALVAVHLVMLVLA